MPESVLPGPRHPRSNTPGKDIQRHISAGWTWRRFTVRALGSITLRGLALQIGQDVGFTRIQGLACHRQKNFFFFFVMLGQDPVQQGEILGQIFSSFLGKALRYVIHQMEYLFMIGPERVRGSDRCARVRLVGGQEYFFFDANVTSVNGHQFSENILQQAPFRPVAGRTAPVYGRLEIPVIMVEPVDDQSPDCM